MMAGWLAGWLARCVMCKNAGRVVEGMGVESM